jgi:cytochrome P450
MSLPPGPSSIIPGKVALAFARDRIRFLGDAARRYGDVVHFKVGPVSFALLNHPDFVRDVLITRHRLFHKGIGLERARMLLGDGLLTSEDERHLRQRRLMQPAFHRERVAAYAETMVQCGERRMARWREGETVDVAREMASVTLAIAGQTLFDVDVEQEAPDIGEALNAALSSFNVAMLPFGDRLSRLPIPPARRFHAARARLDAIIYRLIAERRATGARGHDLLSLLVAARDEEGDGTGMNDEQIRDEAVTLILAGHETTANALAWTWHLLAAHPDAERRLHEEVDRVCGQRSPTVQDVPQLVFTRAVLAEAMRLYPPAYLLGRRAQVDYDVPGTPYVLPARTVVLVSQYLLHRDPRFWENADQFRPERWLDREAAAHHRFAYFPFGAGSRICIGEQFAWMEGALVLAAIARRWRFDRRPGHVVALQPIVTLRPRHGLPMTAHRRRPEIA